MQGLRQSAKKTVRLLKGVNGESWKLDKIDVEGMRSFRVHREDRISKNVRPASTIRLTFAFLSNLAVWP